MDEWTLCRMCLKTNAAEANKSIQDVTYNNIPFCSMYYDLIGISFTDYSELSSNICTACEVEIIGAYKFRLRCLETEDKIKKMLDDGTGLSSIEFISTSQIAESPRKEEHFEIEIQPKDNQTDDTSTICTKTFTRRDLEKKKMKCRKCENVYLGLHMFKNHSCFNRRVHCNENCFMEAPKKVHRCEECDQSFLSRNSYNAHMDRHNNVKRYSCQYCNEKFTEWLTRRTHIYKVHLKKSFCECPYCGKGFSKKYYMNDHINEAHVQETSYQCDICGNVFWSRKAMKKHAIQHMKKEKCNICEKWLKNRKSLMDHMKLHRRENN